MRRMLEMTVDQAKEEEITNDEIRRSLGNFPKAEGAWTNRQSFFAGRTVRVKSSKCPKMLLAATC